MTTFPLIYITTFGKPADIKSRIRGVGESPIRPGKGNWRCYHGMASEDPAFWQQRGVIVRRQPYSVGFRPCLLLAFCVWMLFSAVAVNLPKVGFNFTDPDQLLC